MVRNVAGKLQQIEFSSGSIDRRVQDQEGVFPWQGMASGAVTWF